ncbi:MAG: radical SAM protein [bacterium]|nr:radical SAM protein [bacterium]
MSTDTNFAGNHYRLLRDLGRFRLIVGNPRASADFAVYTFNANGWLVGWYRGGTAYRCGLDGRALAVRCAEAQGRRFQRSYELSGTELETECCEAKRVLDNWRHSEDYRELPVRLLGKTPQQVGGHFKRIWQRVAILPPDQYAAAVVRLTQGCAYNRCRFCSFYKDVPYRVLSRDEFAVHLDEAESFFENELEERRGVFFADANAANADVDILLSALAILAQRAEAVPAWRKCWSGGAASFLDTFSKNERSAEHWRNLCAAGLKSLYLGVETGSESLRRYWKKPGSAGDIIALADNLKSAGISLGVIVLSGAEPEFVANGHREATVQLLNSLPLDSRDRIYISEYQPIREFSSDAAYVEYRSACRVYTDELKAGLRFAAYPQGPVVSLYDVWQFLYI